MIEKVIEEMLEEMIGKMIDRVAGGQFLATARYAK